MPLISQSKFPSLSVRGKNGYGELVQVNSLAICQYLLRRSVVGEWANGVGKVDNLYLWVCGDMDDVGWLSKGYVVGYVSGLFDVVDCFVGGGLWFC